MKIDEWINNPESLIDDWIGLIKPGGIGLILLIVGAILIDSGHVHVGAIFTTLSNAISEITTRLFLALRNLVIPLFVVLFFFKHIRDELGI